MKNLVRLFVLATLAASGSLDFGSLQGGLPDTGTPGAGGQAGTTGLTGGTTSSRGMDSGLGDGGGGSIEAGAVEAVAEIKGLWACLVRWRSDDRRPGSATQEAKTAGSRREPKPLAASFASQGRRMHVRVGKRGGWQEMIGAAAADSAYASAASGGSP